MSQPTRATIAATILTLLIICAGVPRGGPATAPAAAGAAAEPGPAKTPGEAMRRWWDAVARGDEAAHARLAVVRSASGYRDAHARWTFAAARRHAAVARNRVTRARRDPAETGWNPDAFLSPGLAPVPPDDRVMPHMAADIANVKWKVDGDAAAPLDARFASNEYGRVTAERGEGGGWRIVLSDPVDRLAADELARTARELAALAAAVDGATARVEDGRFETVRQVNDYLQAASDRATAASRKAD